MQHLSCEAIMQTSAARIFVRLRIGDFERGQNRLRYFAGSTDGLHSPANAAEFLIATT